MTTYRFAGFWRRFVAYMIDGFIIGMISLVLMIIAGIAYIAGAMSGNGGALMAKIADPAQMASLTLWIWAFSIILNIAYFAYFHGSTGRTPGKRLLGLQVVAEDGTPLSYGIAFLRSVGYLVSSLVFCLGYIWIGFDKKKQGWHDKIAGTVVIIREPQDSAAGISISDSVSGPQQFSGPGEAAGAFTQVAMNKTETPSNADGAGPDGQKIP